LAVSNQSGEPQWYTVRCIFRSAADGGSRYEERITLWHADDLDAAIALAEREAADYAEVHGVEHLGLAQAYWLTAPPGDGGEVFSLERESELDPEAYLDQFFDTGREGASD
jgi:hypothetical protein